VLHAFQDCLTLVLYCGPLVSGRVVVDVGAHNEVSILFAILRGGSTHCSRTSL
jgi:hypothetical protein